ncbi:acylneuraminate cytidylyltransferase family protein [Helicobacter marmotae]|uniref:Acylneuraminate cytidylyltransferase family protein n=1 Tax=Helicobacter marmotae TaxID=152490 RepID=A0A3D8I1P0_9HELI|nr:acylneuraminate cytidylyltransferase family protein [Helicobacter marmotae]RDU59048.1 acylneuraminate cytidylyltransferase family protein [Helicobacter marmotae]
MAHSPSFLAIIPARSGSKRLKDKNIKPLCGKPLLAWSIESALDCDYIDEVVVSTDSTLYADIALSYGASVPFIRPDSLSKDTTTTFEVLEHCIHYYKEVLNKAFDYVVLLQPTSPLRQSWHIKEACEKILSCNKDSLISISPCEHSPLWCNTLGEDEDMSHFLADSILNVRSQDLPQFYRLNGVLFIAKTEVLLTYQTFFTPKSIAYKIENIYSSDIDSALDFDIATLLANRLTGGGAEHKLISPYFPSFHLNLPSLPNFQSLLNSHTLAKVA